MEQKEKTKGKKKHNSKVEKTAHKLVKAAEKGKGAKGFIKALKPVAGLGADALALRYPFLRGPRELLRRVAGFDERAVSANTGGSCGVTVRTMDAPVAFARNNVSVGSECLGKTSDGEVWTFRDMVETSTDVYNVVTDAVANTFDKVQFGLTPISTSLFPNFAVSAAVWEKYRPLRAVLHYCHFANTTEVAAVMLAHYEDVANSADWTTSSQIMGLSSAVQGSAYEDFSLAIEPPDWKEGIWLYMDYFETGAEISGLRQNFAGGVVCATDMNANTAKAIGRWYVEFTFEVSGRRPPISEVTALESSLFALPFVPLEHRAKFLACECASFINASTNRHKGKKLSPQLAAIVGQNKKVVDFMHGLDGQDDTPVSTMPMAKVLTSAQLSTLIAAEQPKSAGGALGTRR